MLAKTQNGTEVSVEFIKDVEPNENGFYCEIRRYDEDGDCEEDAWDNFCIHPEDCPNMGCFDECGGPTSEAEEFAKLHVEGLVDDNKTYTLYFAVMEDHSHKKSVVYSSEDKKCVEMFINLKMREKEMNIKYTERNDQWDRPYKVITTPEWDYGCWLDSVSIAFGEGMECETRGDAISEAHYIMCEYAHDLDEHYLDDDY